VFYGTASETFIGEYSTMKLDKEGRQCTYFQ